MYGNYCALLNLQNHSGMSDVKDHEHLISCTDITDSARHVLLTKPGDSIFLGKS